MHTEPSPNRISLLYTCVVKCISISALLTMLIIQFNSIQFYIIYVPSEQLQGQLQTQHSDFRITIIA
jgi:hypothetical protein